MVTACATKSCLERRTIERATSANSGTVSRVIRVSNGEMVSIITSTAATVSTSVGSLLVVITSAVWIASTSLVRRLSSSPRRNEST